MKAARDAIIAMMYEKSSNIPITSVTFLLFIIRLTFLTWYRMHRKKKADAPIMKAETKIMKTPEGVGGIIPAKDIRCIVINILSIKTDK